MQKNLLMAIGAIVTAAIVIGAGLAVFANNKADDKIPEFEKNTGTIYGNADGNCYINSDDVKLIKKVIDGEVSLDDYPFADANNDGNVDDVDIEIVNKYINNEPCTLKVLDSENKIQDVKFPITNIIVLCGSNLAPLMNVLDVTDRIVGAAYTSEKFDPVRDYPVKAGIDSGKIKQITTNGTAADFTTITDLKDNKDCHFMMTELSSMYALDSDENIGILNGMGIDVVRMETRDPGQDLRSLAVFGILLKKSDNVKGYQDYINATYQKISDKIGEKAFTKTSLISSLTSNLSGPGSGYTVMLQMAKSNNVITTGGSTQKVKTGDTWFLDPKYSSDVLLLGSSCGYSDTGFKSETIGAYTDLYKNHDAWKTDHAYIYSTSMPVVVRVAYFAECIYGDCFEENFAHNIHQEYVNKFFKVAVPYEVNDNLCCIKISGST